MRKVLIKRLSWLWLGFLAGMLFTLVAPEAPALASAADSQPFFSPNLPTSNYYRVGIATHPWWLDMHLDTFIYNFKQLGVGVVRLPFEWKTFEPQPGQFDWSVADRLYPRLNDEGFEIVAEFITIPPWASSNPAECAKSDIDCGFNVAYASQFQAGVEAAAARYPFIRHWEFWNEPEQWPNAGRQVPVYNTWLNLFYQAIKKTDPTMLVAATTLAGPNYLKILYALNPLTATNRNYPWDAVAFHPYLDGPNDPDFALGLAKTRLEDLRQVMIEHGESSKPIWITEIGYRGSPQVQADLFRQTFDWMLSQSYIDMVVLHMLHDWSEEAYGLMSTIPQTYQYLGDISPSTKFVPKQPYFDTYKFYPKRRLTPPPPSTADSLVFPSIGHTVRGVFKRTWETRGGLSLFGYPKTGQFYERNAATGGYYLVQYFERVRMEYHPELKGTPYEVQFGLLGNETMVEQGLLDKDGRPKALATFPEDRVLTPGNQFFAQTAHNVSGPFLAAWQQYGGLAIIGLPKSAVYDALGTDGSSLKIQYFERARMELHTAPDGHQFILFGLLANQRLVEQGRLDRNYQPVIDNFYNPANVEFAPAAS
jgi:hypothetical protein